MAKEDKKIIDTMMARWKLSMEAESENRKNGLDALKFSTGGEHQWEANMLNLRKMDNNRPSESYNQIPQFIHQITNDERMNSTQVRFIPGNEGSKEVAEVYEDLARNIQSSSDAEIAYDTAMDFQVRIGWGYWRILTEYENDNTFDQIIKVKWIKNPFTVYDDPNCVEQDRSDRKFLFIVADMPKDDFNIEYDKKYGSFELDSIGDSSPDWATADYVRVVEYYDVKETRKKKYLVDGKITDKLPKSKKEEDVKSRDFIERKIIWRKCTAMEVLEEQEVLGQYIPVVFVAGESLNVDGKDELSGIVKGMMAPQRQYNYWVNAATEMVALAPKAPFIAAVGQLEGLEKFWDNANTKSYPWLPYKPVTINGTLAPAPQRQQSEAPIQAMMAMVQAAQQNMYTTTGIYPAALGRQGNETSGKAINARKVEGEVSNFHFPDNMARAKRFEGRLLADLIPLVYDAPRAIRLLKEDKSDREVRVNETYTDENGETKNYDLTVGTYDVAVTTGPSYTTKRQEAADSMIQLMQTPLGQVVAGAGPDLIINSMDWPGADKLAERIKKTLPPQLTDDKPAEIPPEIQQQMQQAQQMIDQLTQTVHQQADQLEADQLDIATKKADLDAKLQQNAQDAQSDKLKDEVRIANLEIENKMLKMEAKAKELDAARQELNSYQVDLSSQQPQMTTDGEEMQSEEEILGKLEAVRKANAAKQENTLMEQQRMQQEMEMRMMREQEDRARSDALLQGLNGIQQMLGGLMASIAAPKSVVRDPATGLIQGVVTDNGTMQ